MKGWKSTSPVNKSFNLSSSRLPHYYLSRSTFAKSTVFTHQVIPSHEQSTQKAEEESNLLLKEKLYKTEQEVLRLQKRLVELYEGLEKYITSK